VLLPPVEATPADGVVVLLLLGELADAIPDGFTGEPTAPGVALGVDWNGLLFQNAKLGLLQWPSL
jgi:hypothetical protein